jgi:hypothetical protein
MDCRVGEQRFPFPTADDATIAMLSLIIKPFCGSTKDTIQ